ncbi:MAG: type II toxin-antitoxin system HicA family toxin [candidate division KSB1 bacterium]|nr:type II toxin-antitoxin system HicA family toxin [candidate division KSB1 bacterium]
MPKFGSIKQRDRFRFLKKAGFDGPYTGGKHQFMIKENNTLRIPNPHQSDIGKQLLARILRQAQISQEKWETL